MIAVGKVVVVVAVAVIVVFFLHFLSAARGFWEYSKLKYRREGWGLFRFSVLRGGWGAEF